MVKRDVSLLIVDDDPSILDLMSKALEKVEGISNVDRAESYRDVELLLEYQSYDLALVDYQLGDGDGLSLLRDMKARLPEARSVLLTAHGEKDVLAEAIAVGVSAFLSKPFTLEELVSCVQIQVETFAKDIALSEVVDHYSNLVNALPDIVYKIDGDGNFIFISDAIRQLGYEPDELIGEHISVLIHPEDYFRANSKDVLRGFRGKITGDSKAPKLLDERRKGSRMTSNLQIRLLGKPETGGQPKPLYSALVNAYGEISCSGLFEQDYLSQHEKFEGTVGVIRDISQRVKYERELMDIRLRAEEASRAKSDFLANMSHETRTPMNHILGGLELLQSTGLNQEQEGHLLGLRQSSEKLQALLEDVLALSQIDSGDRKAKVNPFGVQEIATPLRQHYEDQAAAKGLGFHFNVPTEKKTIHGDLGLIQEVLNKLLSNAIKFTSEGSVTLTIRCHGGQGQEKLCLVVEDTGIGVPNDQLETIFDRFVQADGSATRAYGGTGTGLALCRELCELMGGYITIESVVGEGAKFEIHLPVSSLNIDAGRHLNKALDFEGQVLVVVDEEADGDWMKRRLEQLNLRVCVAFGPNDAIKTFMMTNVHIILIEESIAIQNRGGLMREIRRFVNEDQVLPIFALQRTQSQEVFRGLGATGVLPFYFRRAELLALLEPWKKDIDLEQEENHRAFLSELGLEDSDSQGDVK